MKDVIFFCSFHCIDVKNTRKSRFGTRVLSASVALPISLSQCRVICVFFFFLEFRANAVQSHTMDAENCRKERK